MDWVSHKEKTIYVVRNRIGNILFEGEAATLHHLCIMYKIEVIDKDNVKKE